MSLVGFNICSKVLILIISNRLVPFFKRDCFFRNKHVIPLKTKFSKILRLNFREFNVPTYLLAENTHLNPMDIFLKPFSSLIRFVIYSLLDF